MRRYCLFMALAFVVAAVQPTWADDNQIAQFIVQKLKTEQQQGNLQGFHVDMRVDRGTVWFKGFVSNPQQELLILRTAQQAGSLGVVQVVDEIEIQAAAPAAQAAMPQVAPSQQAPQQQVAVQGMPMHAMPMQAMPAPAMMQTAGMPMQAMPMQAMPQEQMEMAGPTPTANAALIPARENYGRQAAYPVGYMQDVGPTAVSQAPVAVGQQGNAPLPVAQLAMNGGIGMPSDNPQLPGYAWPGYAAAPNYAAVTYPRQYSASAWPYIGPFYPYPQVPLGWRSVTLEWDDGWWYLDFNDRNHGHR